MKILFVCYLWERVGGLEGVSFEICRALVKAGPQVEVWSLSERGEFIQDGMKIIGLNPANRYIRYVNSKRLWRTRLSYRTFRQACRFDLVIAGHAHVLRPLRHGLSLLGKRRPPCWAWVHGREVWGYRGVLLSKDLSWADRVVSVSRFTANEISRWVKHSRMCVIRNMVDTKIFTPIEDTSQIRRDEVLVVGRLTSQSLNKGYDVLIQVMPIVEEKLGRKVYLSIVGDGDGRSYLEDLTKRIGISDRVRFRGRISLDELIEAYRRCAVFAMPSRIERGQKEWFGEGFGIVYIEAAACGRPVIASTDGGAPEAIIPGKTGLLVDPRRPEDVADAIASILSEPQKADAMGQTGREWVESNFTIELFQNRVKELLDDFG